MTFEEWLESDEGVLRFGNMSVLPLELRQEWIADARIGWNAAIEAAASACDELISYDVHDPTGYCAAAVRALSSNAALTEIGRAHV